MYFNLQPREITEWLEYELITQRKKLKEYEIISQWKQNKWLPENCLSNNLTLFRTHFFIFHQLFHFHKKLLTAQQGLLEIHALSIFYIERCPKPKQAKNCQISNTDHLMHYYLDWRPLFETTQAQIQSLMQFASVGISEPYRLQQAFQNFEIKPPTSTQEIKQKYRKLVMRHHPDKGGDVQAIQAVNADKALLMRWLEHQHI